ncbi:hypothetical protein KSP40_PGU013732 [Platanthera guangdongensis]|uniref:Uncharacterized protein n=1 Tax=Platanthera guangdongensis TaxID=2320717 RepID=A0ABR2N589_9ASPA
MTKATKMGSGQGFIGKAADGWVNLWRGGSRNWWRAHLAVVGRSHLRKEDANTADEADVDGCRYRCWGCQLRLVLMAEEETHTVVRLELHSEGDAVAEFGG